MDPYKVLELPRGASRDEVEAAYKRLARTYHPDRHSDRDSKTQQAAMDRMREINEARDLLRRAGYVWRAFEPATASNNGVTYPYSGFPRTEPYYDHASRLDFNRRIRRGIAFWLIVGLVVASMAIYLSTPPRLYVRSDRLNLGECFVSPGASTEGSAEPVREGHEEVRITDCDQIHEGQVYGLDRHPSPSYNDFPGSAAVQEFGLSNCARDFESKVNSSAQASVLLVGAYTPDISEWKVGGNRTITCFVWSPQGPLQTSLTE